MIKESHKNAEPVTVGTVALYILIFIVWVVCGLMYVVYVLAVSHIK